MSLMLCEMYSYIQLNAFINAHTHMHEVEYFDTEIKYVYLQCYVKCTNIHTTQIHAYMHAPMGTQAETQTDLSFALFKRRSTALGVLNSAARIAIIASNFTFGAFQNVDPSIPILMAAVTLITGGVSPLFLPLSSDPDRQSLLGKHFRRWMNLMWSKIKKKSQHAH